MLVGLLILFLVVAVSGFYFSAFEAIFLFIEASKLERWREEGINEAEFLKNEFLKKPGFYLFSLRIFKFFLNIFSFLTFFYLIKITGSFLKIQNEFIVVFSAILGGSVLYFFIFEIIGKSYGFVHKERLLPKAVLVCKLASFIFGPFVFLINFFGNILFPGFFKKGREGVLIIEKETRFLGMPTSEEVSETEKKKMLSSVFEFGKQLVKDVMTPRTQMVALEVGTPKEEILKIFAKCGYSRIPVYEGEVDNILGILYVKDLIKTNFLNSEINISEILRPAQFVPETKKVDKLLKEMKISKNHLALVIDEYGGISGLVTFEDLIEEIVGDIKDEYDKDLPEKWRKETSGSFILSGDLSIEEANKILGTWISKKDYDTIGGFVLGVFGRIPRPEEFIEINDYRFIVKEVENRRIKTLKVLKNA